MLYTESNRSDAYYKFGTSPPTFGHYRNILSRVQHMFSSSTHHHICTLTDVFFLPRRFLHSCKTSHAFATAQFRLSILCDVRQRK